MGPRGAQGPPSLSFPFNIVFILYFLSTFVLNCTFYVLFSYFQVCTVSGRTFLYFFYTFPENANRTFFLLVSYFELFPENPLLTGIGFLNGTDRVDGTTRRASETG